MSTVRIERVYTPAIETSNAINAAAAKGMTQRRMAGFYADCIRAGECDWPAINAAIKNRWPKGLQRVKDLAWKELRSAQPSKGGG